MTAQRKTATAELERRRKESVKARDNIIRAIESGMISDALRERYKALDEEIISLEAAIKDYVHEYPKFTKEQIIGFFRCFRNALIDDTENTERLNEQLLDTFLNSAFLYDDGRLVICFNYSGPGNKITITELEEAIDDFFETPDCRDSSGVGESSSDSLFSLPSIREPVNAYDSAFAGFFHIKIARMDTLYRYRISVAKSFKRPNIREYSNGCRPVHHQKSISQFQEKDGLVPCAEERRLSEKRNASFLFNLVVLPNIDDCLTVIDMRDKM